MKKQVKNVEVSARSLFGRPSEMDREIQRRTEKGWTLVNTVSGKGNRYLLTFEYVPTEEDVRNQRRQTGIGCIFLIAVLLIWVAVSAYNQSQNEQNISTTRTVLAVALAQSAATDIAYTSTSNAMATLTTYTPSPLPTLTLTPSKTLTPSLTPTPSETLTPSLTPTSSNTPIPSATPLPSSTPAPTQAPFGTRDNPYPGLGEIRDGRFKVNSIQRNMTASVKQMNMFNTSPDPGDEWVIADVTFHCDLSSEQSCNTSAISFEMVGKNGNIYRPEPLAVITKAFGGEVFGGGQVSGNVAYIVASSDKNLEVVIDDFGRTYFRAP